VFFFPFGSVLAGDVLPGASWTHMLFNAGLDIGLSQNDIQILVL
jgi:hypothetical protein